MVQPWNKGILGFNISLDTSVTYFNEALQPADTEYVCDIGIKCGKNVFPTSNFREI